MSKRELGFLHIGVGAGLMFAVAAVVEFVLWCHPMFNVGFAWRPGSIFGRKTDARRQEFAVLK